VYDDILTQKFQWKKEHKSKMIQTDDLVDEDLLEQVLRFRSVYFPKYF